MNEPDMAPRPKGAHAQLQQRRQALYRLAWALAGATLLIGCAGAWTLKGRHDQNLRFHALQASERLLHQDLSQSQQQLARQRLQVKVFDHLKARAVSQSQESVLQWQSLGDVLPPNGFWLSAAWAPGRLVALAVIERPADWAESQGRWRDHMSRSQATSLQSKVSKTKRPAGDWLVSWRASWEWRHAP